MKRALAFASAVLFAGLSASLALADAPSPSSSPPRSTLLNDLVRMTRAGDSDAALLAYARARRTELPPELNAATLRWLRDSGVRPAVVSYMSAIDVRAQSTDVGAGVSAGVTYADAAGRTRAAEGGEDADYDAGDVSSSAGSEIYTGLGSNAGGAPYSDSYDDAYGRYGYGYGYGPYYGYGYPYWGSPFPTWFVVDVSHDHSHGHHGGWRDHDHHGGGGHDGSGWHHGGGSRHDGWRDRGSHGSRDGGMTAGRTSPRAAIAGSARGAGGARNGRGGPAWGGRNPGEVGPRGRPAATRGFTRPAPGFHGPASGRSGGSIARAPITAPTSTSTRAGGGGVRTAGPAAGSAGGRGRR